MKFSTTLLAATASILASSNTVSAAPSSTLDTRTLPIDGPFSLRLQSATKVYDGLYLTARHIGAGTNLAYITSQPDPSFNILFLESTSSAGKLLYRNAAQEYSFEGGFKEVEAGKPVSAQEALYIGGQTPVAEFNMIKGQMLARNGTSNWVICLTEVEGQGLLPSLYWKNSDKGLNKSCLPVTIYRA